MNGDKIYWSWGWFKTFLQNPCGHQHQVHLDILVFIGVALAIAALVFGVYGLWRGLFRKGTSRSR